MTQWIGGFRSSFTAKKKKEKKSLGKLNFSRQLTRFLRYVWNCLKQLIVKKEPITSLVTMLIFNMKEQEWLQTVKDMIDLIIIKHNRENEWVSNQGVWCPRLMASNDHIYSVQLLYMLLGCSIYSKAAHDALFSIFSLRFWIFQFSLLKWQKYLYQL